MNKNEVEICEFEMHLKKFFLRSYCSLLQPGLTVAYLFKIAIFQRERSDDRKCVWCSQATLTYTVAKK